LLLIIEIAVVTEHGGSLTTIIDPHFGKSYSVLFADLKWIVSMVSWAATNIGLTADMIMHCDYRIIFPKSSVSPMFVQST